MAHRHAGPVGGVVQRMKSSTDSDSDDELYERPSHFSAYAEKQMVTYYNSTNQTSDMKVEYQKNDLARCHVISFEQMRDWLLEFEADPTGNGGQFESVVMTFISASGNQKEIDAAYKAATAYTASVQTGGDFKPLGVKLLKKLFTIAYNLRPDNTTLNSYISGYLDPPLIGDQTGKLKRVPSEQRLMIEQLGPDAGTLLRSPRNQSRIISSSGPVAKGDLTPRSGNLLFGHDYDTRNIHSDNVWDLVYPGIKK